MRILVTNDDGWFAPGLQVLCKVLASQHEIIAVAPDRNRSGASHALTLQQGLRAHQHADNVWAVEGTPVDCVHYALGVLYPELGQEDPDMIVSGMNHGQNLGDDTLYSGTVAGAVEGRYLAYPSLAVSVASRDPQHLTDAATQVLALIKWVTTMQVNMQGNLADSTNCKTYNVNIPDRPAEDLQGMQFTRLGSHSRWQPPKIMHDPRGRPVYWIGGANEPKTPHISTDFGALKAGAVSVTPLQTDFTHHAALTAAEADEALALPAISSVNAK